MSYWWSTVNTLILSISTSSTISFLNQPITRCISTIWFYASFFAMNFRYLRQRDVEHIRIDGSTGGKVRHERVASFQNTASCRVAVLAITAAGVAITLTAASTVFFAEMYEWSDLHLTAPPPDQPLLYCWTIMISPWHCPTLFPFDLTVSLSPLSTYLIISIFFSRFQVLDTGFSDPSWGSRTSHWTDEHRQRRVFPCRRYDW